MSSLLPRRRAVSTLPLLGVLACAAAPAIAAEPQARSLDAVQVRSDYAPYRALTVTGATKTEAPLRDLPISARVLDHSLLEDAGVTDLAGALDMASGITKANNLGGLWDSYSIRGFTGDPNFSSDYMVNGFNASRGYNGLRDGANTQSVEVIKGPASALYGRGEPGGAVNIVTKKPLFDAQHSVDLSAGRFDSYRAALDSTGPLSETVAYRVNLMHKDQHSFRDTVDSDATLLAPSLLWMPTPDTTVSYELELLRIHTPFDRGVTAIDGDANRLPASRFLGEPGDGDIDLHSTGHQVFAVHGLNQTWSLQGGATYRDSGMRGFSTEPWTLQADDRTLRRERRYRDYQGRDIAARAELLGTLGSGKVAHHVLFGIDGNRFNDSRYQLRARSAATPYSIDVLAPRYGVAQPGRLAPITDTDERQQVWGVYAQDQIDLGARWKALLGVRYDHYQQDIANRLRATTQQASDGVISPRAGLTVHLDDTLSLYASAAAGFRPNSGVGANGQSFAPEKSRSLETGLKYVQPGEGLEAMLAVFRIDKENVLSLDPADTSFSLPVGQMRSEGAELDLLGRLTPHLAASVGLAYTDSQVTRSSAAAMGTGLAEGRRFPNVPRFSGNAFVNYAQPLSGTRSAAVGVGVSRTGERLGSVDSNTGFVLPAYTVWRLVGHYDLSERLRLYAKVENLTDRRYAAFSYSEQWVYPGAPRTWTVGARLRF
ncbi:TonB-dependent siderophore receptor [Xanthomonas campestris pv. campestris]|uniref:TonB-dependent siderophore receptor n=1 Tax=Xanthomonas campestris TaxID=339 RepID=UPI000C291B66|nr:TonB-dependent siderophore receptor [Xanthomonas campestris]MCD0249316.1 TonB-dependent siderophore receptor [Xanthomonas campestris pv. campestris]MCD0262076.1 TonB-dependent siderophore receptor [Xanthomonas campestris pv. campestris]MCD0270491.1 TonB-dependent siderophore receptor [Xanthomonas campestris pv. campestris]MDO0828942.1 TonB-dependent siderophore receptor [Xanthomonas campestris pv. campestris]MEB1076347.1 TonB-dependent siderophore receptor [Xanthomonas campestris pv. campes